MRGPAGAWTWDAAASYPLEKSPARYNKAGEHWIEFKADGRFGFLGYPAGTWSRAGGSVTARVNRDAGAFFNLVHALKHDNKGDYVSFAFDVKRQWMLLRVKLKWMKRFQDWVFVRRG
jgi:hypothetical protein